ncbi:MAG: ATP-dependent sacrificial sulfur transferase LarE [Lentisphaeria bacterium]
MTEKATPDGHRKLQALRQYLNKLDGLLVAYSGGVDSTFLAVVAHQELGDRMLAVTATSEAYPTWERDEATDFARQFKLRHKLVHTSELDIPEFKNNPPDRCYYCKQGLFENMLGIARQEKISYVADGTTADDLDDHRPGRRAAKELHILSPLLENDLTKDEIRALSKDMQLPTWDKPAFACLASRFPYGEAITAEKVNQIEQAENILRGMGFRQYRVRHHGHIARIEVPPEDISRLAGDRRRQILQGFKELGFQYITLDLQGYRTGAMNETLDTD